MLRQAIDQLTWEWRIDTENSEAIGRPAKGFCMQLQEALFFKGVRDDSDLVWVVADILSECENGEENILVAVCRCFF